MRSSCSIEVCFGEGLVVCRVAAAWGMRRPARRGVAGGGLLPGEKGIVAAGLRMGQGDLWSGTGDRALTPPREGGVMTGRPPEVP